MSEFTVQLLVLENAVDGLASTFLVVAQSVLGDSSDYVPFQLTLSTRPLPEFTENVSGICTWHNDVAIPLVCYDVKVYCKCMACYSALLLVSCLYNIIVPHSFKYHWPVKSQSRFHSVGIVRIHSQLMIISFVQR